MSNAFCMTWRIPGPGLRPSSLFLSNPAPFRSVCRDLRISSPWRPHSISKRFLCSTSPFSIFGSHSTGSSLRRSPLLTPFRSFKTSASLLSEPAPPPVEHGIPPRPEPFSAAEITQIFGPRAKISPKLGNRVLAVLQGRRIDGTLDLDLPSDITRSVRSSSCDAALEWLRENYPIDEDAAILARIEREELEEERKLIQRAEALGLYKPQSGTYGAELGEGNDPSGKSILQEIRGKNEAKLLAEQERKRQEWLEGEQQDRERAMRMMEKNKSLQKFEDYSALEVRERADPTQRPLLAWIQKLHIEATQYETDASGMTTARRILPSLAVTIITIGLCYAFAANYEVPTKADRMWPDIPPAAATAIAIIGVNAAIFVLWKFPPAWRLLNRYFISVPGYPSALSVIGSTFSHQQLSHFALNMFILWFIGTRLHDEIGRGNFLALYIASGAFGSIISLAAHVLRGNLLITSLGASGAISGIVAAWCMIHGDEKLTIFFLPREWQEVVAVKGWIFLAGIVAFETLSLAFPLRAVTKMDHWAHLGGYLVGALWAVAWRDQRKKEREKNRSWFERVLSK